MRGFARGVLAFMRASGCIRTFGDAFIREPLSAPQTVLVHHLSRVPLSEQAPVVNDDGFIAGSR